ncbi:Enoyl-CoA hydratase/isomerase protein [Dioscorea alata]|uniref:Enoyl-CoA hydratase/isomerase protein n=1 Tax=Dioscorea alata TaxID=55571 RepID=A0ACB7TT10_DIOAL|nr:Enoyl-CoA hydratase/isomerase protein [Dioscorea alata]
MRNPMAKSDPFISDDQTMCSLEKRGPVFVLTLTGDGDHRLGPDVIAAIRAALATARNEALSTPGGAALVTTAEGRFFSNGFDLGWAKAAGSPSAARARLESMVSLFSPVVADLLTLPMPTIAAITGHAAAAGFVLAMSHDHVLMREDRGVLYMSEMDLGLPFPEYFMVLMRSKIVDPRTLRDVALGAMKIGGKEAKERGIVDRVYPGTEETLEAAMKLGEQLAGRGWVGTVYAETRKAAFPELCKAVVDVDEDKEKVIAASKL